MYYFFKIAVPSLLLLFNTAGSPEKMAEQPKQEAPLSAVDLPRADPRQDLVEKIITASLKKFPQKNAAEKLRGVLEKAELEALEHLQSRGIVIRIDANLARQKKSGGDYRDVISVYHANNHSGVLSLKDDAGQLAERGANAVNMLSDALKLEMYAKGVSLIGFSGKKTHVHWKDHHDSETGLFIENNPKLVNAPKNKASPLTAART